MHVRLCSLVAGIILGGLAAARGVSFQFSAPISTVYGPGAATISNLVTVGMTCTGMVSYNLNAASPDLNPSTNSGIYQFTGTEMQMSAKVGTNVFSSTSSSSCYVNVMYQSSTPVSDGVTYEIRGATLNSSPVPGSTDSQTLDVSLSTTNLSAQSSDALLTEVPLLSAYPIGGATGFYEVVFYTYKNGAFYYGFSGTLSSLVSVPTLSARVVAGQLVLSWPTNAIGFQLQSAPTLGSPSSWTALGGLRIIQNDSFQVTPQFGQTNRFFRLSNLINP
jgi:hypothetical protein